MPASTHTEQNLRTPDGRDLFMRCEGTAKSGLALVVVHGLGEHSGCYDEFLDRMIKKGAGVLIYDQHGHGRSPGRRGDAPDFATLVDDIAVALEYAAKHFADAELILLGHSMGGNLVLNHLLDRDHEYVRRAIVTNPMILPPDPPTKPQALAAWLTGKLVPHLRFAASIDPLKLSKDPEKLASFAEDELVHQKLAIGIGSQLINQGIWLTDNANKLRQQLLVLTGSEDELCDRETTETFIHKARGSDPYEKCGSDKLCTHVDFQGLRHSLFIEKERQQVYDAMDHWLSLTAASSQAKA